MMTGMIVHKTSRAMLCVVVDGTGFAFLYDQGQARWAYTGSLSSTATTASPDAFAAMVVDLNVAESTDKVIYQKPGNIKIATNQDIFIWA